MKFSYLYLEISLLLSGHRTSQKLPSSPLKCKIKRQIVKNIIVSEEHVNITKNIYFARKSSMFELAIHRVQSKTEADIINNRQTI